MKDVRKFLGLANYYRRFIKNFAQVARPMNTLTRKDVRWQWGQEQQRAFNELKGVINFIQPYFHQFFIDSYGLNGYGKPLKIPFDRYQSRLEAINNGQDIRQINW